MKKLRCAFPEEMKKESLPPWWRNQGTFLLISFTLHMLIIIIFFHFPLYTHHFSLPKIIEVKIIEEVKKPEEVKEVKKFTEIPTPNIAPAPLIEKTKKVTKTELIKTKPPEGKIRSAHKSLFQAKKVILDNIDLGLDSEYASQLSGGDDSWLNEKIIFPEKKANPKTEEAPPFPNTAHLEMAVTSIPGERKISEKAENSFDFPGAGSGIGGLVAIPTGGVWLEGRNEVKGNIIGTSHDGISDSSPHVGHSPGHGYSKIKGNNQGYLSAFLGMARKKIEEAKRYPWEALRRHWEGKVILSFLVDQKGEIKDIKILQSSGYKVLDEEAKATLLRASPLPLPPQIEDDSLKIEVPILFRIE